MSKNRYTRRLSGPAKLSDAEQHAVEDAQRIVHRSADETLRRHFLRMLAGCGPEGRLAARELADITGKAKQEYGSFALYVSRLIAEDARSQGWL